MSTTDRTAGPGLPLAAEDSSYVKRELFDLIRELGDHLREAGGEKLEQLVLDMYDELDRQELDRDALFRATVALTEYTDSLSRTAGTLRRLARTVSLGWVLEDDPARRD